MPRNWKYYPALIAAFAILPVAPLGAQSTASPVNQWTASGRSPVTRSGACGVGASCLALPDGRILSASASDGKASFEVYNPSSGKSVTYPESRTGVTPAGLASGRVLLLGGMASGIASTAVDVFDPVSNTVAPSGTMAVARTGFSATLLHDGTVLIAGGTDTTGTTLSSVEIYDPTSGQSTVAGQMLFARANHAATLLPDNNQVLIAGGSDGGTVLASAELYTPWTGVFSQTGSLSVARQGMAQMIVSRSGNAVLAGGANATGSVAGSESFRYATIVPGQSAYAKGSTVAVSGDGWAAGAPVTLTFAAVKDLKGLTSPFVASATADAAGHLSYSGFQADLMHQLAFTVTATDGISQGQNYLSPDIQDATAVVVTSVTPLAPVTGQAFTLLATVTDTTTPATTVQSGSVTFTIDGTAVPYPIAVGPNGTASLVLNPGTLAVNAAHTVTLAYTGSGFASSTSQLPAFTFATTAAPTLLTVAAVPSVPYGTNPAVSASLTIPPPGNLVPAALDGTISITILNSSLATVASCPAITVGAGSLGPYTCTPSPLLPAGAYTVQASYTPGASASYQASTGSPTGGFSVSQLVIPANYLTVAVAPRYYTQPGALTATLNASAASLINAADTVQFSRDSVNVGTGLTGTAGAFSYTDTTSAPYPTAGTHTLAATFSGDANVHGVTNSVTETIYAAPTTTSVLVTPIQSSYSVGALLTVTATVNTASPLTPSAVVSDGTVAFYLDGAAAAFATAPVGATGQAQTTISTLTVAGSPHSIVAVYTSGAGNYTGSKSASSSVAITSYGTSTGIVSGTPAATYGNAVTYTVTVTGSAPPNAAPTGTVVLTIGGVLPGYTGTLSGISSTQSHATITVPGGALPVGNATLPSSNPGPVQIAAAYSGDTNYASSSNTLLQTVNPNYVGTTTTIATPSTVNLVYGQIVQLAAAVTANAPSTLTPPGGNITYTDMFGSGSGVLSPLPGQSSFGNTVNSLYATKALAVGTHRITAAYLPPDPQSGNTFTGSSSTPATQLTVAKAATSVVVSSTVNGTFTAVVSVVAPGSGIPTGVVTFRVASGSGMNGPFGYANLITNSDSTNTNGQTFIATWQGTAVNGTVTAVYSGDNNFLTATSNGLPMSAPSLTPSTVVVSAGVDPGTVGQPVTFTAAVSGSAGIATGSAQFYDGTTAIGGATLNSAGQGIFTTTTLTGGYHNISAVYSGDQIYQTSSSNTIGEDVNKLVSTAAVTSNLATASVGQTIQFTVTLGPAPASGTSAQTGTVKLYDTSTLIGTATAGPAATFSVSTLGAGTHYIIAVYSGDNTWYGAASQGFQQVVGRATTVTALTSAPVAASSQITLRATVTGVGGIPTGTVTFVDGASQKTITSAPLNNGVATAVVAPGNASVLAMYPGDSNYLPSNSGGFTEMKAQNAASFTATAFASGEIVSVFGSNLAATTAVGTPPLTTSLGGAAVTVTDSIGKILLAKLYYASPTQINFVMPGGLAPGVGTILVSSVNGANFSTAVNIAATAPGIFSAGGNGQGPAAAIVYDQPATGTATTSFASNCAASGCPAAPIVLNSTDQFYLELFGTGISNATSGQVTATVNGLSVPVSAVAAQSQYPGLDQVNIGPLPLALQGAGAVNVVVTVNNAAANTVTVNFK